MKRSDRPDTGVSFARRRRFIRKYIVKGYIRFISISLSAVCSCRVATDIRKAPFGRKPVANRGSEIDYGKRGFSVDRIIYVIKHYVFESWMVVA